VSFRSHRQFSTPQAAEEFLLGLHEDERSGELIFDTGAGKRKLLDAVVPPPRAWIAGPMLIVAYDAAGGGITTAGPDIWLPSHIDQCVVYRMVNDSSGYWFEVGFESPVALLGNAADGWTDPDGNLRFRFQRSETLTAWDYQWITCPTGVETTPDGFRYWARSPIPAWWYNVVCDLTLTSNRYGKSITGLSIGQVPISLPGYPYAMPSQAATLQTHLRAAGYTGAVVSSVSQPLTVGAKNHTIDGTKALHITQSGSNVTMVRDNYGTNITSGMSYPYSMPSQRASLQTALRAAGQSGAVVMLYGDEWTIFLPDRPAASPAQRQNLVTITPDDPYPAWDRFGTYLGNQSAAAVAGTSGNVRASGGGSTPEANKQFGRMQVTPGPNYQYYGDTPP
jgi:hypothetical protein